MERFSSSVLIALVLLIAAVTAQAGTLQWFMAVQGQGGGGADRCAPLSSVLASAVADLDATCSDSYGGSGQTWASLETGTDYDFFLGVDVNVSTDDPAFTGSAGDQAAYFLHDGGDFFHFKGTDTAFIKGLHKTTGGSDFWVAIAYKHVEGAQQILWGNATGSNSVQGLRLLSQASEIPVMSQNHGSAATFGFSTTTLTGGTDTLLIVSHSHGSDLTDFWINTTTKESIAQNFGATTTDPINKMHIGSQGDEAQAVHNTIRIYSWAIGNEFLDDTKAGIIITHMNTRHNRTYAKVPGQDDEPLLLVSNDNWLMKPKIARAA